MHIIEKQGQLSLRIFLKDYNASILKATRESQFATPKARMVSSPLQNEQTIKMADLVLTPEKFDGKRAGAREWAERFEKCIMANNWSESIVLKYFLTFLIGNALDWYLSICQSAEVQSWIELKEIFLRFYLGKDHTIISRRQLERMYQKPEEGISVFIPKVMKLNKMVNPTMREADIVDMIKGKLRSVYLDKLVTASPSTIQDLNDSCLAIEANMFMQKIARVRESREKNQDTRKEGNKPRDQTNQQKSSTGLEQRKCCKCERMGHIATRCSFKTKENGSVT